MSEDLYLQSLRDTLTMCDLVIQNQQVLGDEKVQQARKLKAETEERYRQRCRVLEGEKVYGTLDDLLYAAAPLCVADEAAAFLALEPEIDPWTGAVLTPGDPERCAGNGKEDPMACCCDACNFFLACFPEWDK